MRKLSLIILLALVSYVGWQCSEDPVIPSGPTAYEFPVIPLFSEMPDMSANPVTVEGVALGKQLFFDPILSSDFTVSCGTCHEPEKSFSSNFAITPGVEGALGRRNAMTLVNLAWYKAMNWDGRENLIRNQNVIPVQDPNEMHLPWPQAVDRIRNSEEYVELFETAFPGETIDQGLITKALEQFQLTLISYNSPFDKFLRGEDIVSQSVLRGFEIFRTEKGDCFHCHSETNSPELFVTTRLIFTNNGLDSIEIGEQFEDAGFGAVTGNPGDNGKFKIPTLRNLAYTAPYMHDGRFNTLDEVIEMYNRGPAPSPTMDETQKADAESRLENLGHWGLNLSEQDKTDLKNFLLALTDESFVTNPAFQAP